VRAALESAVLETTLNLCRSNDRIATLQCAAIVAAVALTAALGMVFVAFKAQGFVANEGDPYHYGAIARGFVDHGFTQLTRRAASLYPEFIAVVYRMGFGNQAVEVLQAFFHAATCLIVLLIGKRLYNMRTGFLAGLFCTLHPMLLRYVGDLHMESALTLLCTLTLWCAVRMALDQSLPNGIALGAVGMVATLTKGVALPYVVVFLGVLAVRAWIRLDKQALCSIVAAGLTMAVLVAPWTYRNYRVTGGRFVLLAPGASDSFLRGYIFTRVEFATLQKPPYTDAENESNTWFRRIAREAGTRWELDEVEDEINNARVAKQLIHERPFDTVRKVIVGVFTFWYEMTSLTNSLVPASLAFVGWVLAFIGMRRARHEARQSWLLLLPIAIMNLFVAILIPLGRYSVPILPCLLILAAFGADTLLARVESSRHREAICDLESSAPSG
jgi:4-amino-4-deoxy-L-arabinose transferase-like glycosyltransferase